jgi:putative transposase
MDIGYRTYRYRLRPTARDLRALERTAGSRRFVYNWALERWREHYAAHRSSPPSNLLYQRLTELRRSPEHAWLTETSSSAQQQAVADVRTAYRRFFEGTAGYPRFRSKRRDRARFRIPGRIRVRGDSVWVPRVGWVRMRLSRPLDGELRSATFTRGRNGHWFVSILSRFPLPPQSELVSPDRVVGVDLGLVSFAVLSDGTRIAPPRIATRADASLRRGQRRLARKRRGSRNRARARRRLARLHAGCVARRSDFLHKLSSEIVRKNDLICMETLDARGLARTKVSKGVLDAAFGEFKSHVMYKAAWSGKATVCVGRFFASSKTCSACGAVNSQVNRKTRCWSCSCGAEHDRDLNAARNIRAEGLRIYVAAGHADAHVACGAPARPPMEARGDEAGIPPGNAKPVRFRSSRGAEKRSRRGVT